MAPPLSYVFWHWPRRGVTIPLYEEKLVTFHRLLRRSRPSGMGETLSFRIGRLPWKPRRGHRYEDWYVVQDFSALGVLNSAAVAKVVVRDHDSVAEMAAGGAGAVYKHVKGALPLSQVRLATWFQKPTGLSYQSFYEVLDAATKSVRSSLWQRQMALGPAPEFCLQTAEQVKLPTSFRPVRVEMRVVGQRHRARND